jgi:hypothetical protein
MAQTSRTFRIFVSSTFPSALLTCAYGTGAGRAGSDLKAERNALEEKSFSHPLAIELCY